jgi:glyoxylase-like metal-dependent hydrolase (beta-lactamase superfamily II)
MRRFAISCLAMMFFFVVASYAEGQDDYPALKLEKFGGKILAVSSFTDNNRILAIATQKGIVVVNTTWSPDSADHVKSIIEKEFGRNDYAYAINTDDTDTRVYGNAAFADVPIIAHAETLNRLVSAGDSLRGELAGRAAEFDGRVTRTENQLKFVAPGSEEAKSLQDWIDFCRVVARDMKKEFEFLFPNITFTDELTLDMGDMTIRLISYRLSSGSGQIAVVIPEEGVVYLGDMFHAGHLLPRPRAYGGTVDLNAWIEMMKGLIDEENNVKYVLRSNGENWSRERMAEQIEFITGLIDYVDASDSAGKTLKQTIDDIVDLRTHFPVISNWDIMYEDVLIGDIKNFVTFLWSRNHQPASEAVLRVIREEGIDAAKAKFEEIKSGRDTSLYLVEADMNRAGYALMGEGKIEEAIAVFEMNVSAFPDSSNVYDSLGEALMNAGRFEEAIAEYEKSIALDPRNENAKTMIKRMKEAQKQ